MVGSTEKVQYFLLQQQVVSPDVAEAHREILDENVEYKAGSKLHTVTYKQVLQDFGVRNWNGRIYTEDIVMRALNSNAMIQNDLAMKSWSAEYGHPILTAGMNELARQMTVHPPNICNTIDKYWKEGNLLMGQCTTVAGGYGDMLRDRILTGYPAMASSRAIGGVDAQGRVLPNYTIRTFDTVDRPSHKVAYQVPGSAVVNVFQPSAGNTMSECAMAYDPNGNADFASFIMSESASREKVNIICEAFQMEYDSMEIKNRSLVMSRIDESGITKVVMPLNKLVGAEYHNLMG